ncbi:hypothetical protein [Bdellovibrio sp. HCB337]|uniref:hypothetical protein n=1 Tax=Bdellovibrio sp. HCB337 TaxID=3394358 RepID=UPI0039A4060D
MKQIMLILMFLLAMVHAQAQSIENDPYSEDQIDMDFQQEQGATLEKEQTADTRMKIELNQSTPTALGMSAEEKLALDNQRRQKAILTELSGSSDLVRNCITRNNKSFRGTHITLMWVISPMGRTQKASIKSTDIGDLAIRDCIKRIAARFDFSDAAHGNLKKSVVEYTYRFNGKSSKAEAHNSQPAS